MIRKHLEGGRYLISETGEIWDLKKGKELRVYFGGKYPSVCINGRVRAIHRLLAILFIPNPENKEIVNHVDGNKENFKISNLEWCTRYENTRHALDNGLIRGRRSFITRMVKMKVGETAILPCRRVSIEGARAAIFRHHQIRYRAIEIEGQTLLERVK